MKKLVYIALGALLVTLTAAQSLSDCYNNCINDQKRCNLNMKNADCMVYRFECMASCNSGFKDKASPTICWDGAKRYENDCKPLLPNADCMH